MTTFFLVRHAVHELGDGILTGRSEVRLSREGRAQAQGVARKLASRGVTELQSSPRARTRETAEAIAAGLELTITIVAAADEVDFGDWSGKSFAELSTEPRWGEWNSARNSAAAPGGETVLDVEQRIIGHMNAMHESRPEGRIAIVSHAETIRTAVLHYLGMPFDSYDRLEIAPASITTLIAGKWGAKLVGFNEREAGEWV